jgi:glyoxylase-like metal-dependent hydrolase (beta-lactamase superfamily II)
MPVIRDGPYRLSTFAVGPYDNNIYILSDPRTSEALLIDAANEAALILRELEGLRVSHILTTHGHADHVQAARRVRELTQARFACHPADEGMMPLRVDQQIADGDVFRCGGYQLRVLHTPGHTPGSVCFQIDEHLISGDTLFPGGPGNTANPRASFPSIIESIRTKLFALPDETQVLPGLGAGTTIGRERPHLAEWIERGW